MDHELITVDEKEIVEKWNVGKLSGKLIAASNMDDALIYDLLSSDDHLSVSKADCVLKACARLIEAKNNHEKVFVGGDYDADGICSTAIMKRTLDVFGIENGYYIPDRFKEGYGLNAKTVELAYQKGYSVILTVDNGVKAHDALLKAKQLGMFVIVTDHHEIEEEVEADIVVHPDYMESEFSYLSGAGVALEISRNLIGTGSEFDELVALCSVALIGDVMPEWKETRKLIKKGISIMKQGRVKSLRSLLPYYSSVDETAIAFNIVPKLNAVGRMNDISNVNTLVPFLLSKDDTVIASYSAQLNTVNEKRKELSEIENRSAEKMIDDSLIQIIYSPTFHEGICGLVAGRLANTYHKPFLVLSKSNTLIKGSGRSVPGFNLFDFLSDFDQKVAFGGHEQAVGISIKEEDLTVLKEHVSYKLQHQQIHFTQEKKKAILLSEDDVSFDTVVDLSKLSPYPRTMIEPLFALKDVSVIFQKETPKTIRYEIQLKNNVLDAIVYKRKGISTPENVNGFVGKLQINRFRGKISLQMIVEEILH